jgi:hypothetical protein
MAKVEDSDFKFVFCAPENMYANSERTQCYKRESIKISVE